MALQIVLVFVRLGAGEAVVDLMGADQLPEERGREVGQAVWARGQVGRQWGDACGNYCREGEDYYNGKEGEEWGYEFLVDRDPGAWSWEVQDQIPERNSVVL